jgi:hypothetical protein
MASLNGKMIFYVHPFSNSDVVARVDKQETLFSSTSDLARLNIYSEEACDGTWKGPVLLPGPSLASDGARRSLERDWKLRLYWRIEERGKYGKYYVIPLCAN